MEKKIKYSEKKMENINRCLQTYIKNGEDYWKNMKPLFKHHSILNM